MVARTFRHEVGDLLQTVYSSIAILRSRLPAGAESERRLLADFHAQAEACKFKLDAIQDLTCPLKLNVGPTNLAEVVAGLAARLGPRYPQLQLRVEAPRSLPLTADGQRLGQVGHMLLLNACQVAHKEVQVHVGQDDQGRRRMGHDRRWSRRQRGAAVVVDGAVLNDAFRPIRPGSGAARRVVEMHGGSRVGRQPARRRIPRLADAAGGRAVIRPVANPTTVATRRNYRESCPYRRLSAGMAAEPATLDKKRGIRPSHGCRPLTFGIRFASIRRQAPVPGCWA